MIRIIKNMIFLMPFLCLCPDAQGQNAVTEKGTENARTSAAVRKPVEFSHVPFLLLKITPTAVFGRDNVFQYGAELVPPFGKVSLNFDYGKGKGSWNLNKYIKNNQAENSTTIYRGEIRAYFSDWYPFYAMDKKPFGRYYSLEFVQKDLKRFSQVATGSGGVDLPDFAEFEKMQTNEKEYNLHLKIGRHIIIHKLLFLDIFAGAGIGQYKSISVNETTEEKVILHSGFVSNRKQRQPNTKGYFFSTTAGLRLALPI